MRRTKIVATVGPSSDSPEVLERLIEAGVDVFRLNFSHGDHSYHGKNIENIREVSKRLGKPVAILQDLSGPKIRITYLKGGKITLHHGETIKISKQAYKEGVNDNFIYISHPEALEKLEVGSFVNMADGTIRAEVVRVTPEYVECKVVNGGVLSARKGVNFPGVDLDIPAITDKDVEDLRFGVKMGVDLIAVSFVRDPIDVLMAKKYVASFGGKQPVFAKIERHEAVRNIEGILEAADGIMVARGDLGVEVDIEEVPIIQKKLIRQSIDKGKTVITATQMLTSMINSPFPTRADVSDIANAVLDGTDAVMLSDETTVGKYPVEAVDMMAKVIKEAEKIYPFYRKPPRLTEEAAIAYSAAILARDIDAHGIAVFTCTGRSALRIARYRPKCPIIACTTDEAVLRRLSVVWGVVPFAALRLYDNFEDMVKEFMHLAERRGIIEKGKRFIALLGTHFSHNRNTNTVMLLN